MVLAAPGGDVGITMYCQEPRAIRKSCDVGVIRRGQVGSKKQLDQVAKTTALGTPDLIS